MTGQVRLKIAIFAAWLPGGLLIYLLVFTAMAIKGLDGLWSAAFGGLFWPATPAMLLMTLDDEYWADGRHMTAEGNRLRAELIAAYLDETGAIPKP